MEIKAGLKGILERVPLKKKCKLGQPKCLFTFALWFHKVCGDLKRL